MAMHAPDMVFENHTAGERAEGEAVREHIGSIFETWPDIRFDGRRTYCRDGLVVQEWTATATHANEMRRGDLVAEPTGKDRDLGRPRRDPVRGRARQAQGRLLGLGHDPEQLGLLGRAAGATPRLRAPARRRRAG